MLLLNVPKLRWLFATLLQRNLGLAAASRVVVSAVCEATRGVGDT